MSDERLNRIEDKIDNLNDKVGSIDRTLAEQHISLKEHIKRTNLLEAEIKPLKVQVNKAQGALMALTIISILVTIVKVVFELMKG